jgi:hypothetical protein
MTISENTELSFWVTAHPFAVALRVAAEIKDAQ